MKYLCLITALVALLINPAFGQFYEYKDKNGNTVITNSPPSEADYQEKQINEERVYRSNRSEKDYPVYKDASRSKPQPEEQRKKDYSRVSVVMYMTDWCGYCKKAGEYIRSMGADLVEYNIEKDKSKRDEMRQKVGGGSGVPVIDIEGTIIRGYNQGAIKAALDRNAR
jgi:glutaredoxin